MIAKGWCASSIAPEKYACVNRAKAVNVKRVAEATEKYAK